MVIFFAWLMEKIKNISFLRQAGEGDKMQSVQQ